MRDLLGRVFLVICFSISSLEIYCATPFCPAEKSADNLMGIPLYVICCFSLVAFTIFSLSLIFVSLINMCLGVFLLEFILHWIVCTSWTWVNVSFPTLGKVLAIISSNVFSGPFSFSSLLGTPIMQMLVRLILSQILWDSPHFFSFFLLYSVLWQWFAPLCLPAHLFLFCLSYSATDPF